MSVLPFSVLVDEVQQDDGIAAFPILRLDIIR